MSLNAARSSFILSDLSLIPFDDVAEDIFTIPPAFAVGPRCTQKPLAADELLQAERVWLEPISTDLDLAVELRGWYWRHADRFVQSEFGNRFYLDTYG